MVAVPGLPATEKFQKQVKEQWGIDLKAVPHWTMLQALGAGTYCDPDWPETMAKINLRDIYDSVRNDFSCQTIATGYKKADSIWRRRMMSKASAMAGICAPLADWNKRHVIDYLRARKLPIPETTTSDHNVGAGIDLKTSTIIHLYEHQREDYEHLRKWFPYIDACIKRKDLYGVVT